MSFNGHSGNHSARVARHFILDVLIVAVSFFLATYIRLADHGSFIDSLPGLLMGAFAFSCTSYILGLYAFGEVGLSFLSRLLSVFGGVAVAFIVMASFFYATLSFNTGRGIMFIGWAFSLLFLGQHHFYLYHRQARYKERAGFIVGSREDESVLDFLLELQMKCVELDGVIVPKGYSPECPRKVIGMLDDLDALAEGLDLDLIIWSGIPQDCPETKAAIRRLRYSGVRVLPAVSFCEEIHKFVPLRLVNDLWLYHASIAPHSFYIRKLKRAFDIIGSLAGLLIFSPLLVLGMIAVKWTSSGPLFYRQVRSGKNGLPFEVLKLRTMHTDAEKDGARWASGHSDPRLTPVGGFLRKYRIDELPQFINVLRGEMSFVGPRPERPEFIEVIAKTVPLFHERLMIAPGITGWAQVNYPYGASVEDAAHKLEYDFYYMKHMNIFLDILILLDTVRLILRGGLGSTDVQKKRWLEVSRSYSASAATPVALHEG